MTVNQVFDRVMFCDASDVGFGGFVNMFMLGALWGLNNR
jgi:Pyruvate/2-oxoacid:ferredoxin oxidoreductase gamma subunit